MVDPVATSSSETIQISNMETSDAPIDSQMEVSSKDWIGEPESFDSLLDQIEEFEPQQVTSKRKSISGDSPNNSRKIIDGTNPGSSIASHSSISLVSQLLLNLPTLPAVFLFYYKI